MESTLPLWQLPSVRDSDLDALEQSKNRSIDRCLFYRLSKGGWVNMVSRDTMDTDGVSLLIPNLAQTSVWFVVSDEKRCG